MEAGAVFRVLNVVSFSPAHLKLVRGNIISTIAIHMHISPQYTGISTVCLSLHLSYYI